MAESQDKISHHDRFTSNQVNSSKSGAPYPAPRARQRQKIPFAAIILPVIALAIYGHMISIRQLSTHLPEFFANAPLGPAVPVKPVFSQMLPPPERTDMFAAPKAGPKAGMARVKGAVTLTAGRGDTLQAMLTNGGIRQEEAILAVSAIKKYFNPRELRIGQQLKVTLQPVTGEQDSGPEKNTQAAQLAKLELQADPGRMIVAKRGPDGVFASKEVIRPLDHSTRLVRGRIDSSLFEAAETAKMHPEALADMVRIFSYDVDFARDIQPGDGFEVIYDRQTDEHGQVVRTGAIRYAALILGGEKKELFRFKPAGEDEARYFDRKGAVAQKALLKTPIDGARLSSRFGMRKHPVLGYTLMHKGLDFAASTGTPVMAAGDGRIEMAKRNGSYGKYIRIHHNSGYSTAYAHLSGFARDIKPGSRVRQGQVIGYTGTTGRSTGPHLHYEVLIGGKQVNPQSIKLPIMSSLSGKQLAQFKSLTSSIDKERKALMDGSVQIVDAK